MARDLTPAEVACLHVWETSAGFFTDLAAQSRAACRAVKDRDREYLTARADEAERLAIALRAKCAAMMTAREAA